jgi:protein-tyrosine kinase
VSIVEKAIAKLQQTHPERKVPATVVAPARETVAVKAPAPPERPRTAITSARRVTIDIERLRAQGFSPSPELANRMTDQYRRIKWRLLAKARGPEAVPDGRLLMVTSSMPDEGKTFTAINLALGIAMEKDCTVLLVDADVAKAHVTQLLGLAHQPGLTDLLAGKELDPSQALVATNIEGLTVLPAGQRNAGAPELFASRRMSDLITQLAMDDPDRIVLFDSSPVLATNESQLLGRLVGQVLMVVRADHTPQPAVQEAIGMLDASKSISLVLNQVKGDFAAEYYGGYGHYSYESQEG